MNEPETDGIDKALQEIRQKLLTSNREQMKDDFLNGLLLKNGGSPDELKEINDLFAQGQRSILLGQQSILLGMKKMYEMSKK